MEQVLWRQWSALYGHTGPAQVFQVEHHKSEALDYPLFSLKDGLSCMSSKHSKHTIKLHSTAAPRIHCLTWNIEYNLDSSFVAVKRTRVTAGERQGLKQNSFLPVKSC